jgi:hypothetical protein
LLDIVETFNLKERQDHIKLDLHDAKAFPQKE